MRTIFRKIAWSRVVRLTSEVVVRLGWRAEHRPASFVESLSRSVRLREIAVAQGMDYPVWRLDDKVQGREFARNLGVRVPELYAVGSVDECVAAAVEMGSVVIKPLQRHSSQGVVALTRRDGGFFDHMHSRWVATSDLEKHVRSCQVSDEDVLMAEGLVIRPGEVDIPSYDWKFFCFGGRTGLIYQFGKCTSRPRSKSTIMFRRPDFTMVDMPYFRGHPQRRMSDPRHPDGLRHAAESYALAADVVFARIDMYEDDRGPVFGEITPHPAAGAVNGNNFGRAWDRLLGEMWDRAEVQMSKNLYRPG